MQEILKDLRNKYPEYWQESAAIEHIRKKTLQFLLIAYCGMGVVLSVFYFYQQRNFLLWRVLFFSALSLAGFQMLRRGVALQQVGHYALSCLTLIILSTALLYKQGHYLVTFQFIFIILCSGFYILGAGWGLFYSLLNIFVIGLVTILTQYLKIKISFQTYTADPNALAFTVLYNYAMLLYVHFFFFKESELANAKEKTLLKELKIAAVQAQDLADYKTNFLITMSHEIRTPLHAIIGGLDLIISEKPRPDQKNNLESVRFSADVLKSIIDDLLNLNDLEGNQTELRREIFQPVATVAGIFHSLKATAGKKGLTLSLSTSQELSEFWVIGDPVRLAQIVMNLINNAIKYTEQGSVEVTMQTKRITDDLVEIFFNVSDTGIGIPTEVRPYIFEPFKLINSGTKKQYHGTGLGLRLIQRLVHLLGGKLEFTSQEGVGSSFFFDIPYPLAQIKIPVQESAPEKVLAPLQITVLVAEDDQMNALILKNFLRKWGAEFDFVENGLAAIESMKNKNYHVVLMDINMPVMDGIEATQKIRAFKDPEKANVPIIALTAANKESLESSGIPALFDDWIAKPFHPHVLHGKLAALI
ncbi:ATP-binding protein [Dyadobacter sp. CY261]|uniref:ATP-binding protein n=1 Tax=Dyadobacter sp. CY261 TaxID=2907203 RepID=UPI001F3E4449|nr:ATP-binding protein [Dyadobacter sp. CY261]MCF0071812.1 ATP-binding protein [Dyadobacter sp. CY261]